MSLLEWLKDRPEDLLIPNESVLAAASEGLKQSLDGLAKKYTMLGGMYVDGLKAEQVWVQAQMVMEGVAEGLGSQLAELQGSSDAGSESESDSEPLSDSGSELASDSDEGETMKPGLDQDFSDEDELEAQVAALDNELDEDEDDDGDDKEIEDSDDQAESDEGEEESENDKNTNDPQGANSDGFDLAEFQQHVLQLEQDPNDDDEFIDYGADLQGSSDGEADLHYKDFFAPPAKKSRQETKPKRKVQFADDDEGELDNALPQSDNADSDDNLEMVMESARKDLFDSDEETDPQTSEERLSKFEQQQRDLARQIEELENQNIGDKEWGMRGEIKASQRPEDSLVDAELEFERGSKPAPVNTAETTSTLEELIKERIRKQNFDDLPRRSELAQERAKPELADLPETKSQKSLAELYEEDQMRAENPEYYSKQDSAAMEAAHAEITDLFTSLSRKLDALCSWHYTPKAAAPSVSIVTNQPSISMEEAQPGTMATGSQLAPQEVYKAGEAVAMANAEMTTSLKRKKRRDKAKSRADASAAKAQASSRDKASILSTLKKGNVTLIDRRGQKRDMRGNEVKDKAPPRAENIKL